MLGRIARALPLLAPALLAAAAPAVQDPPPGAPPNGPRAVLESVEGEVRVLPLSGLDTADPRALGGHLLRFEGLERPDPPRSDPDRASLELAGGGRLHGRLRGGEGESIALEILGGSLARVPIEELERLVFPLRVPEDGAAPLEPAPTGDRLYLFRSGGLDRVDGAVEAFSAEGVRFDSTLGSKLFPWAEVSALFVEPLGDGGAGNPSATPVTVDLIDGSRLRGDLARLTSESCRVSLSGGREVALPLPVVSEIQVEDGRLEFLSALEPAFAEQASPFGDELGMRWPHRIDRSVSGGPLRAGGRIYTRGIGVHAPSRIGWRLEGRWSSLRGAVAVDDEVLALSARGSVRFRVLADGEERWQSPVLRGGDPPLALPSIDLSGVEELVLEVDEASDMHVADRADWLRLVLRRSGGDER